MPLDLVQRVNLDQLYLPFATKVLAMLAACRARGADYFLISGYRSDADQTALWAQGRTQPGPRVTNARAGESAHNFGLAVDCCRDKDVTRRGLQPDWDAAAYEILGEEAERVGLVWGGRWKTPDRPHVQWPGLVTAQDLAPLRPTLLAEGLTGVFRQLDSLQPFSR